MKRPHRQPYFFFFLTFLFVLCYVSASYGQLCTGTLGDPVVKITFGAGPGLGPALEPGITDYHYDFGACPEDGLYSIINKMSPSCHLGAWHRVEQDHTGDPNGYMMLVNAQDQTQLPNPTPGDFYVKKITGLCPGTTYEFGAYVMNILMASVSGFDPKLTFRIETTVGDTLKTKSTGDIPKTNSPTWVQYATQFTVPVGISEVVLRIRNLAPGGNGNDLIIDDITFRPCGPIITSGLNGTGLKELPICEGTSSTHSLKAVVSASNQEFQWQTTTDGINWGNIQGATNDEYQAIFNNASPGIYQYRLLTARMGNINSPNCRSASEPLTFKVNAIPPTTIIANTPLCEGETLNLGASGGSTYNWTGPNFSSPDQNPTINTIGVNGTGQYQVIIKTAEGCETIKNIQVVVNSKPVASFITSNPICEKEPVNFFDQSSIGSGLITEWQWDFGDGNTSTLKNPTHTYIEPGLYHVSLTAKSDNGCTSLVEMKDITVNPKAQISFNDPGACVDDVSAQFIGIVNTGVIVQSWEWDFGDGTNDLTEKFKQNPKHKYLNAQSYSVVLKVKTDKGCETSFPKNIIISGATPQASFTVINENSLCSNQLVSFKNTSAMPGTSFGRVTKIEWNFNYTGSNSDIIETIDNPEYNAIFTHQYPISNVDKRYKIQLKAYSGTVCYIATAPFEIKIKGSPEITFSNLPAICQESDPLNLRTFVIISNGYTSSGSWIFSGQGVSSTGMFDPSQATVGSNVITAIFNPLSNCASVSKSQTIIVKPSPIVNAGEDFTMLEGGEKQLEATANSNLTYKWTLADGSPATDLSRDDILNPIASPKDDVTYRLTVTSNDQCINTDEVSIQVLKLPKVPNTFTPNGDGTNDYWRIMYLDSYPNATIEIYNRYGNKVFGTSTYQEWDGRHNGSDLPVGTYYYIINPKNGRKPIKGSVSIVR
ncbi:MAG: type sorting protein [Sphingobacteriales bacterium]|nr:type sorting protein [Sphingobacteriales bacterium]